MKNNTENELIERYLYDVIRRLPEKQKKDIEQELRSLIDDMIEEQSESGESREQCVKTVLTELGSPAKLARSYRNENNALISGEYFDNYCYILKIVLICTAIGLLISNVVSAVIHVIEMENVPSVLWNDMLNIGMLPSALIQVFGWITLGYAVLERSHVKINTDTKTWSLDKLPDIPYKKSMISRGDCAVGIAFSILLGSLLLFVPQLFGVWIQQDGIMTAIPFFNLAVWKQALPLCMVSIGLGIIDELVKLISRVYTYTVMTVTIITNLVSYGLIVFIFKAYPIMNPNFNTELESIADISSTANEKIRIYFNTDFSNNIFLILMLLIYAVEIGITVYRTLRYSKATPAAR